MIHNKRNNIFKRPKIEFFNTFDREEFLLLIVKGILIGIVAGTIGSAFRYIIHWGNNFRHEFMATATMEQIILWTIIMMILGWCCHLLLKWAPLSGGSGIPQIEGEMKGIFNMNPFPTLVSKFFGGAFTGIVGFSVGREGPSVQLGGATGKLLSNWFGSSLREERILTSAGAAAGLTAAFSAPVSGAIFVFEEVHKSFYPKLVIPTFSATISANLITSLVFGLTPSLGFSVMESIPIKYFATLLILGVGVGFFGIFFNRMIVGVKSVYDKLSISRGWKISLTFLGVTLLGLDSQLLLGGGNDVVTMMVDHQQTIQLLLYIVIGKIILTSICYGNGAQGGIFLPMVVIGSAVGALMHSILVELHMLPNAFGGSFIICGMAGMLAASMRTPLLAILLVLEMTNSFHSIYQVGTVAIIAYLTAEFMKELPIYDNLLLRMSQGLVGAEEEQTFFQTRLSVVCPYVDMMLKDIELPRGAIIVSIDRGGQPIVPVATTVLQCGDELYVSCTKGQLKEVKEFFSY